MSKNFKLVVITPEKGIPGEAESIVQLFEARLPLLHIRKPGYTVHDIRNLLNAIPAVFHSNMVLHSHYELLNEYNLKGAHLPEAVRIVGDKNLIKNVVSTSFHKIEDIMDEKMHFEYAFLSPIFPSISKQGYNPSLDKNELNDFFLSKRDKIGFPIIALGGITDENILQVRNLGFNGAACIGYIWKAPNPAEQFSKLQKLIGQG